MTQTLQTYGPPTIAARRAPLVLPLDVRRGWRQADTARCIAAAVALPLALVLSLAVTTSGRTFQDWIFFVWLVVGPATFYSLARVLRPEPRSAERTARHLLAGAATAFAVPTIACQLAPYGNDDVIIGYGVPAFVLGLVTVVWGLVALVARVCERRRA